MNNVFPIGKLKVVEDLSLDILMLLHEHDSKTVANVLCRVMAFAVTMLCLDTDNALDELASEAKVLVDKINSDN